jgi:hypothetical protein
MGVTWRPSAGPQEYGCGFGSNHVNDEGRMVEPTATAQAQDGSVAAYGPSPAGAVRAMLTTSGTSCSLSVLPAKTVTLSHRLPSWYPRSNTGWFVTRIPSNARDCVINVKFLDNHGKQVEQPNNF